MREARIKTLQAITIQNNLKPKETQDSFVGSFPVAETYFRKRCKAFER